MKTQVKVRLARNAAGQVCVRVGGRGVCTLLERPGLARIRRVARRLMAEYQRGAA